MFAITTQKLDDEVQNLRAEIRKPVQAFPFWSESIQDSQHSLGLAFCSPYWISGMEENIREKVSLASKYISNQKYRVRAIVEILNAKNV